MTILVEDGSGVDGANSYVSVADVTAYLADRNRQTENSWNSSSVAAQEAAAVAGTDFVEQRFRDRFRGVKKWKDIAEARTVLNVTGTVSDGETVTIGSTVFTWRSSPSSGSDVQIGANNATSLTNLALAINNAGLEVNAFDFFGDAIIVAALVEGTAGNGIVTATTMANGAFSFATTRGGNDDKRPQPLSFPRKNLFDRDGSPLLNIPVRLKQAVAEYAVRAIAGVLQADIVPDASGRVVTRTRVKVGPIEEETEFDESGSIQLAVYPAADALLREFLNPPGGSFR